MTNPVPRPASISVWPKNPSPNRCSLITVTTAGMTRSTTCAASKVTTKISPGAPAAGGGAGDDDRADLLQVDRDRHRGRGRWRGRRRRSYPASARRPRGASSAASAIASRHGHRVVFTRVSQHGVSSAVAARERRPRRIVAAYRRTSGAARSSGMPSRLRYLQDRRTRHVTRRGASMATRSHCSSAPTASASRLRSSVDPDRVQADQAQLAGALTRRLGRPRRAVGRPGRSQRPGAGPRC